MGILAAGNETHVLTIPQVTPTHKQRLGCMWPSSCNDITSVFVLQTSDPTLRSLSRSPPYSEDSARMMEIQNMRQANSRSPSNVRYQSYLQVAQTSFPVLTCNLHDGMLRLLAPKQRACLTAIFSKCHCNAATLALATARHRLVGERIGMPWRPDMVLRGCPHASVLIWQPWLPWTGRPL